MLILAAGTQTGENGAIGTAEFLRRRGIDCDVRIGDITAEDFKKLYADPSFDVLWVEAHGEFDPAEPEKSNIKLSWDRKQAPGADAIIERIGMGSDFFTDSSIEVWGSPVMYV